MYSVSFVRVLAISLSKVCEVYVYCHLMGADEHLGKIRVRFHFECQCQVVGIELSIDLMQSFALNRFAHLNMMVGSQESAYL